MVISPLSSIFVITLLVSLITPSLVLADSNPKQCSFPAIFNFGDSNSDTGGLSATFGQAGPPNGETFFGGPASRYCDGRLIIDFIAERLGLPYVSAFLDSIGTNFTHGANFATAGSTIRPQNTSFQQTGLSPISLNVQSSQFHDFRVRSQIVRKKGGVYESLMPKEEDFSRALYTFDIGQNDLTAGYFLLNMSTDEVKAYVPELLNQFKTVIENVYGEGGRYFWIHNTGPVGCLPYVLDRLPVLASQIDKNGCASPFNQVAQFFNTGLKKTVDELRKEFTQAAFTYVDVYSLKYSLIDQGKKFGFTNPIRTCCGHGGKYNYDEEMGTLKGCGSKIHRNGTEVLVGASCKDPQTYVNWDGVHFTEAANKYIFDRIVDGSFSDPPTPLNMSCYKQGKSK